MVKFEYGFESVNGIVKKVYHLHEIPNISQKCDVWNILPLLYVRRFTGLKDRNDIDIYEGYKVRVISDFACDARKGEYIVVIMAEYDYCGISLCESEDQTYPTHTMCGSDQIYYEIIE